MTAVCHDNGRVVKNSDSLQRCGRIIFETVTQHANATVAVRKISREAWDGACAGRDATAVGAGWQVASTPLVFDHCARLLLPNKRGTRRARRTPGAISAHIIPLISPFTDRYVLETTQGSLDHKATATLPSVESIRTLLNM